MPITIECSTCFQTYAVKSELAGKKIRCKECQSVILVPRKKERPTEPDPVDEDEFVPRPTRRSRKTSPRSRRARGFSLPALGSMGLIAGIVGGVVLLGVGLVLLIFQPAILGALLSVAGVACVMGGGLALIITAFREDIVCGLMYLFVPFYNLFYIFTRLEVTGKFFGLTLLGFAMLVVGTVLSSGISLLPAGTGGVAGGAALPWVLKSGDRVQINIVGDHIPATVIETLPNGDYLLEGEHEDGTITHFTLPRRKLLPPEPTDIPSPRTQDLVGRLGPHGGTLGRFDRGWRYFYEIVFAVEENEVTIYVLDRSLKPYPVNAKFYIRTDDRKVDITLSASRQEGEPLNRTSRYIGSDRNAVFPAKFNGLLGATIEDELWNTELKDVPVPAAGPK